MKWLGKLWCNRLMTLYNSHANYLYEARNTQSVHTAQIPCPREALWWSRRVLLRCLTYPRHHSIDRSVHRIPPQVTDWKACAFTRSENKFVSIFTCNNSSNQHDQFTGDISVLMPFVTQANSTDFNIDFPFLTEKNHTRGYKISLIIKTGHLET